uniref:Uncharacterized protein n=1 Tax=Phenylobacterium glaciei TaxID=2803784 RepID=A0A974P3M8_9CAUL|nr:hypothetical protein JKL49_01380 [Phenylobacterium glaciei]
MALQGAQRAAGLTARLLAFARRQPLNPTRLQINAVVRDLTDLLHRTLGNRWSWRPCCRRGSGSSRPTRTSLKAPW